jgi:hypothetical protein
MPAVYCRTSDVLPLQVAAGEFSMLQTPELTSSARVLPGGARDWKPLVDIRGRALQSNHVLLATNCGNFCPRRLIRA